MDVTRPIVLKKDKEEQRLVFCEVYAPNRPDVDGEFMRAEEIQKMAYEFVRKKRMDQVDVDHGNKLTEGVSIVESFIARKGDPDFIEGSWVVGIHVADDAVWAKIKKGELNGLSMEAMVYKEAQEVEVEIPPVVEGTTSEVEDHVHKFFVTYDENGKFLGGKTDAVDGHEHGIKAGTVTELAKSHRHRFSSVDNISIVG